MKVAFTICSNNYLAQAKVLGDSFLAFHPEIRFIIGLVDKINWDHNSEDFSNFEFIEAEKLNVKEFSDLVEKYNIKELNTSLKPSFFRYIFEHLAPESVIYLDPDILVLSRFDELLELLDTSSIFLTPHMTEPIDDDFSPTDHEILATGVFNLGFLALTNYSVVRPFLIWWHERVVKYGYEKLYQNMFFDQYWINYVPVFFPDYLIIRHLGYNMANWNLHERSLSIDSEQYLVNEESVLRFFHFSGYDYKIPEVISSYHTRYSFDSRPDIVDLFRKYRELLIRNNVVRVESYKVHYGVERRHDPVAPTLLKRVLLKIRSVILRG